MSKKRWLLLAMIGLISISWSWLFLIDVARLSTSPRTGYFTMAVVFAIIVGISALIFWQGSRYIYRYYLKPKPNWLNVFLVIASWAMLEFLVSWVVALFWSGRGSSFDSLLPFTSLTPLLMYSPVKYLARFTGYFGLSAIVITIIICIILPKLRRSGAILAAITLLASGLAYMIYRSPTGPSVNVMYSANTLGQKVTPDVSGTDVVIFPEYGLDGTDSSKLTNLLKNQNQETFFLGTQQNFVTEGVTNNLLFGSNRQGIISTQSKDRLIPGGEYLPFLIEGAIKRFDSQTYIDFKVRRAVVKGSKAIQPLTIQTANGQPVVLGSEACSSIISARDYRKLTRDGANILTNSASLEIFKGSRLFNVEDRGFAIFMAVANARPFVQSSNNWSAFALDQNGHLIDEINPINTDKQTIRSNSAKTPYTMVGEWLVWAGFVALVYQLINHPKTKDFIRKKSKLFKKW